MSTSDGRATCPPWCKAGDLDGDCIDGVGHFAAVASTLPGEVALFMTQPPGDRYPSLLFQLWASTWETSMLRLAPQEARGLARLISGLGGVGADEVADALYRGAEQVETLTRDTRVREAAAKAEELRGGA